MSSTVVPFLGYVLTGQAQPRHVFSAGLPHRPCCGCFLLVSMLDGVVTMGAVSEAELPAIVRRLRDWRLDHGLSQPAAVEALRKKGLRISLSTLQKWEAGVHQPGQLAAHALKLFLDQQRLGA